MKVVIFCGGQGSRLREFTEIQPKPMIEIGEQPILWHIMKSYAHYELTDFILCLGYKGNMIRRYFIEYPSFSRDIMVTLGENPVIEPLGRPIDEKWRITLAETGENSLTGTRLKKITPYLDGGTFCLTYGDGVSDVNLNELLAFHKKEGRLATVTGVRPPGRFGEIENDGSKVVSFWEKPTASRGLINGGFFLFEPDFCRYLPDSGQDEMLEHGALRRCAADGELSVYQHDGFWQCMDTYRDWQYLDTLWKSGNAPWKTW